MITKFMVSSFLKLDNNQHLPFILRIYMLVSPSCRREVNHMQHSLGLLRSDSLYHAQQDITKNVMKMVNKESVILKQRVSNLNWLFVGIVLFSGFIALSFSEYFQGLKKQFGSFIEIYFYCVFGIAITVYAAMFIASHIGMFKSHR